MPLANQIFSIRGEIYNSLSKNITLELKDRKILLNILNKCVLFSWEVKGYSATEAAGMGKCSRQTQMLGIKLDPAIKKDIKDVKKAGYYELQEIIRTRFCCINLFSFWGRIDFYSQYLIRSRSWLQA